MKAKKGMMGKSMTFLGLILHVEIEYPLSVPFWEKPNDYRDRFVLEKSSSGMDASYAQSLKTD